MSTPTPNTARASAASEPGLISQSRRGFHTDLQQLCTQVGALATMADQAIELGSNTLLLPGQPGLAAISATRAHDRKLDRLTHQIEDHTLHLMALQQPMATDLRTLVSVVRVIHELERIGDNMVNIATTARRMGEDGLDEPLRHIVALMRDQASLQLRTANEAFITRNPALGARVALMDDAMDELQKELFRHVFTLNSSEQGLQLAVQASLIGRYYERVADHASNYGARVSFMVTGA